MIKIAAFYKFVPLTNLADFNEKINAFREVFPISGTVIIADEGVNSTIAGLSENIDGFLENLEKLVGKLQPKYFFCENDPFHRFKVKLKNEIVTFEDKSVGPNKHIGTYISPNKWNELIKNEDVLLLDTRNKYETNIGYFKDAEIPNVDTFIEFKKYLDDVIENRPVEKIAMYCTGGIRCEKSTGYALKRGVKEVYHLEGGILNYLEHTQAEDSLWEGECFVFDHRVSVDKDLNRGSYALCHACGYPVSESEKQHEHYEDGVSCVLCFDATTEERKQDFRERVKQMKIAENQGKKHIGANMQTLRCKNR
ncbi:MAG: rhodanese-related sulfurtransferase [Methylococcales bacterium]|nr:rhodanese-related sulfurtransferase [Methylococcales bacterium]